MQVAATAASITSTWPSLPIAVWATSVVLQREQCLPSALPSVVQVAVTAASITSTWPSLPTVVWATSVSLQREQCLPSVLPSVVQVAATAASITSTWPRLPMVVWATRISPHLVHFLPSVKPASVQVAFLPAITEVFVWAHSASRTKPHLSQDSSYLSVYSCDLTGITMAFSSSVPHTEHFIPSVRPVWEHVESYPFMVVEVCSLREMGTCGIRTSPQSVHFFPSVNPFDVQVEATAWSTSVFVCLQLKTLSLPQILHFSSFSSSYVWFASGSSFCTMITIPHTEQCFPSLLPFVWQVEAVALSVISACPYADIVCVCFSPQEQYRSLTPSSVQVAFFIAIHSSKKWVWVLLDVSLGVWLVLLSSHAENANTQTNNKISASHKVFFIVIPPSYNNPVYHIYYSILLSICKGERLKNE